MGRFLAALIVIAAVTLGGGYYLAGRAGGPVIEIHQPQRFVGRAGTLDVSIESPGGNLSAATIVFEQQRTSQTLFELGPTETATVTQESADRVRITRPLGRESVAGLQSGAARIVVSAARPAFFGLRTLDSQVARDVEVRLEPPRVSVVSMHHFINHGGSEAVVYQVSPPDVESGVRVGEMFYPGYPAPGASGDPATRIAFFALLHDQDLGTPIELHARDEAGNERQATFEHRVFEKPFRRSRIELDDRFLQRVVPAIAAGSPDLNLDTGGDNLLPAFLTINGELRRRNADSIQGFAERTASEMLWSGAFQQLGNSKVESMFADHRTYFYQGREVDQQVHLGFDLAVTANIPVLAANSGTVIFADELGIYGRTIVLDHGMGLQSLYAHLSSIEVSPGARVDRGQALGRSGMTGLAGGDHLHFTMLLQGRPVDPVEWWDPHWIEDRIMRKLREAGPASGPAATP